MINDTVKFLLFGSQNDVMNRKYKNLKGELIYNEDRITPLKATQVFNGNIQEKDLNTRIVDEAIEVFTVTSREREGKIEFWEQKHFQMMRIILSSGFVSLSILGVSFVAKIVLGVSAPWTVTTLVVAGAALCLLSGIRWLDVLHRRAEWEDPIREICENRKIISEKIKKNQAFIYGLKASHKSTYLHPAEILELWKQWKDMYYSNYENLSSLVFINAAFKDEDTYKIQLLDRFFENNPFGNVELKHAYSTADIPENYLNLSEKIKEIKKAYYEAKVSNSSQMKSIMALKEHHTNTNNEFEKSLLASLLLKKEEILKKDEANKQAYNTFHDLLSKDIKNHFKKLSEDIVAWKQEMMEMNVSDQRLITFIKPIEKLIDIVLKKEGKEDLELINIPVPCDKSIPRLKVTSLDKWELPKTLCSLENAREWENILTGSVTHKT